MIGYITDPAAPGGLDRRELSEPEQGPHDTLIEVRAYSLNRGELGLLARRPDGWRPGQDVAGVVLTPAPDGSGPEAGARVAGHADGGSWSELVVVPSHRVAVLPTAVSFADAAGLPAAGLTALRALRTGGALLGRRVLVTGAAGGVGHFAVQLARLAGAGVTALVRDVARAPFLKASGVAIVDSLGDLGPFDLVLEGVGGGVLTEAITKLAPGGVVAAYGMASGERSSFAFSDFPWGEPNQLIGFYLWATPEETFADDLAYLAGLVAAGQLEVHSSRRWDWTETPSAVEALRSRAVTGKAILTIP